MITSAHFGRFGNFQHGQAGALRLLDRSRVLAQARPATSFTPEIAHVQHMRVGPWLP